MTTKEKEDWEIEVEENPAIVTIPHKIPEAVPLETPQGN